MRAVRSHAIEQGVFLRRLNRFVIECAISGRAVQAHLPNPGRLWELLLPGRTLYLLRKEVTPGRKMSYSVLAVERDGKPILLHTQMVNGIARQLIETDRIRGLEGARIVREEAPFAGSRFDFLLERRGQAIILEVKSCTLFGRHTAMFPDAVTERGQRHLWQLAKLVSDDRTCGVLFVVQGAGVRFFMPDYHTDFAFACTFLKLRDRLSYRAAAVNWQPNTGISDECRDLEIPWKLLEEETHDRGSYLIHLYVPAEREISVGHLGRVRVRKGHYLYVGSAGKNLTQRIERHLRRRKKFFWHIDYLRDQAHVCHAMPIRTKDAIEHHIAYSLSLICDWIIPRFGASDCSCASHLFGREDDPISDPRFVGLLQYFRMDRLPVEGGLSTSA